MFDARRVGCAVLCVRCRSPGGLAEGVRGVCDRPRVCDSAGGGPLDARRRRAIGPFCTLNRRPKVGVRLMTVSITNWSIEQ